MNRIESILLALAVFVVMASCSDSDNSIIDDPDISQTTTIDLSNPSAWTLASTPADLFPEASLMNNVDYGKNRALLAWYTIDRLFTQLNSHDAPGYIKNDLDGLSYPYAREVAVNEVFPDRELKNGESSVIETLNLSFYPRERGPYNLDGKNVDENGYLLYPELRWGGIMRSIDIDKTNFEQAGIKYIQFWLLDPFMDPELGNEDGGYLYFNLGEVSEDVLKDGFKSYENGSPLNGDNAADAILTVWGKVHAQDELLNYSTDAIRHLQDVGLDGLINQEEFTHPTYANYLNELRAAVSVSTYAAMQADPFSPFNDPAGDNYAYYRHTYYDNQRVQIIGRYKHYNNCDGNSLLQGHTTDAQYQQGRSNPDVEDINYDNTLNEYERFYQYRIAIRPDSMQVGKNYITAKQEAHVKTRNGGTQVATWYLFTIPLNQYQKKVGSIQDFSNIRFMRIFMTGFKGITHLRFATLELTQGD